MTYLEIKGHEYLVSVLADLKLTKEGFDYIFDGFKKKKCMGKMLYGYED